MRTIGAAQNLKPLVSNSSCKAHGHAGWLFLEAVHSAPEPPNTMNPYAARRTVVPSGCRLAIARAARALDSKPDEAMMSGKPDPENLKHLNLVSHPKTDVLEME